MPLFDHQRVLSLQACVCWDDTSFSSLSLARAFRVSPRPRFEGVIHAYSNSIRIVSFLHGKSDEHSGSRGLDGRGDGGREEFLLLVLSVFGVVVGWWRDI